MAPTTIQTTPSKRSFRTGESNLEVSCRIKVRIERPLLIAPLLSHIFSLSDLGIQFPGSEFPGKSFSIKLLGMDFHIRLR